MVTLDAEPLEAELRYARGLGAAAELRFAYPVCCASAAAVLASLQPLVPRALSFARLADPEAVGSLLRGETREIRLEKAAIGAP